MAEVIWSEPAVSQLESILGYISLDKPTAARAVATKIVEATDQVERFVRLGRPITEFPHKDYRQVWLKPCWIYYRIDSDTVYILHVRRAEKPLRLEDLMVNDDPDEPNQEYDFRKGKKNPYAKKLKKSGGGEGGIRTPGTLRHT